MSSWVCASRPVSVRWAMKFGRDAELAFEEFSATGLPPFPYKQLKKTLERQTLLNSSPRKVQSVDMRDWFASVLTKETKKLDACWVAAARTVLLAARSPRAGRINAKLHGRSWCADSTGAACMLAGWANLACTALRKIIKKYNKQCGAMHGRFDVDEDGTLHFHHGRIRREILSLAQW